jgi:phosphopantothenoylcysteine decarboxylase/phosphopantothenate--cysteine ligase
MNTAMWEHPAVAENVARLRARGAVIIEPERGPLASRGEGEGVGRLAAPEAIVEAVMGLTAGKEAPVPGLQSAMHEGNGVPLAGRRVLVTAGPTREPLDPVRFLSSPSSGKMGFAIAEAARRLGADVILVTGPTHLPDPPGVTTLRVTTAEQMRQEVLGHLDGVGVVVKTAAVADFRPAGSGAARKIGKDEAPAQIALERTPDILAEVAAAGGGRYVVGFAAETGDPVARARRKLEEKNLDLIVANDVSREGVGFGADTNEVTLIDRSGRVEAWPRMSKALLADRLMRFVAGKLEA